MTVVMDFVSALDKLNGLLRLASSGRGQLALVAGGLAFGKTELLQRFTQQATAAGALVLTGVGSRTEQHLPAGLIDQMFRSVDLPPEATSRWQELLRPEALALWDNQPDERSIRRHGDHIVHELCGVLLGLAKLQPLVIAIDDVPFADSASRQLLLYVLRRMRSAPILVVFTAWDRPAPSAPLFHAELTRCPHHEMRLTPLSHRDVSDRVSKEFGTTRAPALATAVHDLTGGNPLLVAALLADCRQAVESSSEPALPVVGLAFSQAVLACLHRWEPELFDVAQGLAVLDDQADSELVGRLVGLRPLDVEQQMHILSNAGLLLCGRFRHAAARQAVLGTIPTGCRSSVHLSAAELLFRRGADPTVVARQLLAADQPAQPWTVPVLRTAADRAMTTMELPFALRCLELALPAVTDPAERLAVTVALARAAWRVNPSATAAYMPILQAAIADGSLRGQDAVTVVRQAIWSGDRNGAVLALRALSDASGEDAQLASTLRLACHWYYGSATGGLPDAGVVVAAGASGEPWTRATNRLASLFSLRDNRSATDNAEQILRSCPLNDFTLEVVACAITALTLGNELDRADEWCATLIEQARIRGAVAWQGLLGSVRAAVTLRSGRAAVAAEQAEEAMALLSPQSWGVLIGYPASTLVLAYTALGRHDDAARVLELNVPEVMFHCLDGLRYLHARGHHHLATGRVLAAISDFQRCGRLMREWSVDLAAIVPWRSDLAQANLRLGRVAVARDLVRQQLEQVKAMDVRTRGLSLRVLAASSELAQRPALLRQAIELLETSGDRIELARALEDLSQVHQQLGEFDRARLLARRASREAKVAQAGLRIEPEDEPAVEELVAEEPTPVRPRRAAAHDRDVLSEAQRRVADLAALGHTNQEISRRLFITVSTVEQHLTRVFRKLGVSNRDELPLGLSQGS